MHSKIICGIFILLYIVSYVSSVPPHFRPQKNSWQCSKKFGERCFSGRECCDSLICQNRNCQCLPGFTWSEEYSVCYQCPDGWTFFVNKCYLVVDDEVTWEQASEDCKEKGGKLMTFDSPVIVDQLQLLFEKLKTEQPHFVGAFSGNIPGNWTWMGEKFLPATGPWWSGCFEAKNEGGTELFLNEGCAQANSSGLTAVPCNDTDVVNPYICEFKSNKRIILPKESKKNQVPICEKDLNWSDRLKKCVRCPHKWTFYNDSCFFFSDRPQTWERARSFCQNNQAQLFVSNSPLIIDQTLSIFKCNHLPFDSYWIGASRNGTNFKWLNGKNLPLTGPMWSDCREPSPEDESKCVATFGISLENLPCNEGKKFICQIN